MWGSSPRTDAKFVDRTSSLIHVPTFDYEMEGNGLYIRMYTTDNF